MIEIEVLPASFGDCILVGWGDTKIEHRMLIDAGLTKTYKDSLLPRLKELGTPLKLELLVVTHIDRDHIRGIIPLLNADPPVVDPKDIWFNGRNHLDEKDDGLGTEDGERLAKLLVDDEWPWNESFSKKAVVVPADKDLPVRDLAGNARLTLLSPYRENLHALRDEWGDELGGWDEADDDAPVESGDTLGTKRDALQSIDVKLIRELQSVKSEFDEDDASPNGSSIAFVFEHGNHRILFGADAHPSVLLRSLKRLSPNDPYQVAAFKLSHHGSSANLSPQLLDKVNAARFIVSSDGSSYGHPHPETLAWIVESPGRTLCFNYACDYTNVWNDEDVRREFDYEVEYPASEKAGYRLTLP